MLLSTGVANFIDSLRLLNSACPWVFPFIVTILGAAIGSFLNVVIYRSPKGASVVSPGSHCSCGKPIAWFDNIPVLSWFILRGKARCCGASFSLRYPSIEAITATLFLVAWLSFPPTKALCGFVLISFLIVGTFIDFDHMVIPDSCTIGLAGIGLLLSAAVPSLHNMDTGRIVIDNAHSLVTSAQGLLIGSSICLWLAIVAESVLKKEAMGFGDVKLLGAIGAFCGWAGAAFALGFGAILGIVWVLLSLLWKRATGKSAALGLQGKTESGEDAELGAGVQIPFGPMLSAAGLIYFLFARQAVERFLPNFS